MRRGQSLAEILVGVAVGAILILAAATIIAPALKTNSQVNRVQTATALAKGLMDSIQSWSESDWHNISGLATGTAATYYLNTSSSPFTASSGIQTVTIGTSTYTRYFFLSDVNRDGAGNITSGAGTYDPSTKLVTVVFGWPGTATTTMALYITRHSQNFYDQTDWSGGPGQSSPQTSTNFGFASDTNISYSTTAGSIYVKLPGY